VIRRFATIRAVTTALATIVVAVALVVGAAGLIVALRRTMIGEVAEAGRAQAGDVVRQLEAGGFPLTLRPLTPGWCWPTWRRWNGCGSARGTPSTRTRRWMPR
jgi:hypothetical protein